MRYLPSRFALERPLLAAKIIAWFIKIVGMFWRIKIEDQAGYLSGVHSGPFIFLFWHNRIFSMPSIHRTYYRKKAKGSYVLTSPSRDGALLAAIMNEFKIGSVRGSSSKEGVAALLEMQKLLSEGYDIIITPDGPRGPRYRMSNGPVFLARNSGAPILCLEIEYSRFIRFNSWDRFMIPLPFSRVLVRTKPLLFIPPETTESEFSKYRSRIEEQMQQGN